MIWLSYLVAGEQMSKSKVLVRRHENYTKTETQ